MSERYPLDFAYRPSARRQYDALERIDQTAIDRLVDLLCNDPDVDGITKFDFPMPPVYFRLLDDREWAIIYRVVPPGVVQLWSIARSDPDAAPRIPRGRAQYEPR